MARVNDIATVTAGETRPFAVPFSSSLAAGDALESVLAGVRVAST